MLESLDVGVEAALTLAAFAGVALDNAAMYARLSDAVVAARAGVPPVLPQYLSAR